MPKIKFLTLKQVIFIHKKVISLHGGAHGLRDINLLKSAIAQPKMSFEGKFLHPNICDMAAAYFFHIIKNHAFVDGNKRTGLLATTVFIEQNSGSINITPNQFYQLAIDIACSKTSKDELVKIFKKSLTKTRKNK